MIAQWSAAIAAAAFVILAGGILVAIRIMLIRLAELQRAAEAMQQDIGRLSTQAGRLMEPAEETIRTARSQLESTQRLFQAAGDIGGAIANTTSAIERASAVLSGAADRHAKRAETKQKADEAFEWAELGMAAWQLWQSGRKRASSSQDEERPV